MERKTRLELATACLEGRYSTIELLPLILCQTRPVSAGNHYSEKVFFNAVAKKLGMTRFERATPSSQARCATKLRHIPFNYFRPIDWQRTYGASSHKRYSNRLLGRVKLRHIPEIFALIIDGSAPTVLPLTNDT